MFTGEDGWPAKDSILKIVAAFMVRLVILNYSCFWISEGFLGLNAFPGKDSVISLESVSG